MRSLSIALTTLVLTACSTDSHAHGVSTDPNGAIGFITENAAPPATADTDGDTPRDGDGRPYHYAHLGAPLPAFSGPLETGGDFDSAGIDQWTIIRVWGAWCGDSRKDAPFAAAIAEAADEDASMSFVSVHTVPSAKRTNVAYGRFSSVTDYFESAGHSYPTVIDADAAIRDALAVRWTPSYLVVSPDGIVRGFRTDLTVAGEMPVEDFLEDVASLRAEAESR